MTGLRTFSLASSLLLLAGGVRAQGFQSGSNGSYGPISCGAGGCPALDLPADGIFHATTVTVDLFYTQRFNRNPLNTPVYLLATGDVTLNGYVVVTGSDGTPTAGGLGGPGGFAGGYPSIAGSEPGAGLGPGGGKGGDTGATNCYTDGPEVSGSGSHSTMDASANDGETYGTALLVPLLGGSGGGGTNGKITDTGAQSCNIWGGGGGGGAILISSSTKVTVGPSGGVAAYGGSSGGSFNAGSGGAVRIVAPEVSGNGQLNVSGGNANAGPGGAGRSRIDLIDRRNLNLSFSPAGSGVVSSFMVVFPSPVPRLDIIETAGQVIAEGTTDPVTVTLPLDSSPNRTVTVQARDFTGVVPIRVVLTPDSGDPVVYDDTIDMSQGNPANKAVDVVFPQNIATKVTAFTR